MQRIINCDKNQFIDILKKIGINYNIIKENKTGSIVLVKDEYDECIINFDINGKLISNEKIY